MTDLSLAVFSLEDFNLISEHYPACIQIMRKKSFVLTKLSEARNFVNENQSNTMKNSERSPINNQQTIKSNKSYTQDNDQKLLVKKSNVFASSSFKIDSNRQSSFIKNLSDTHSNQNIYRYSKTSKIVLINPNIGDFEMLNAALDIQETRKIGANRRSKSHDISKNNKINKKQQKKKEKQVGTDNCIIMKEDTEKQKCEKSEINNFDEVSEKPLEILNENNENKQNENFPKIENLIPENEKTKRDEEEYKEKNENEPNEMEQAKELFKFPSLNEIKEETPLHRQYAIIKTNKCYYFKKIISKLGVNIVEILKKEFLLNIHRFFAAIYSTIYLPLYLAFKELNFENQFKAIEIYCIFIYFWSFGYECRQQWLKYQESKINFLFRKSLLHLFYHFLLIIPFCFIFDQYDIADRRSNLFYISLALLRLSNFNQKLWIFQGIKKKISALAKFLGIILIYLDISHLFACLFIVFGKLEENINLMWFVKLPAPQKDYTTTMRTYLPVSDASIYLHSLYWSYVTSSHVGIGDVSPITWQERLFCTIIMIITTFTYISFFGNMAALFQDLVNLYL